MRDRFDPIRHRAAGRQSRPAHDRGTLRASDEDREHVVGRLRHAASEGRLAPDELEQRIEAAYAARTHGELDWLVSDLPGDPEATERTRWHDERAWWHEERTRWHETGPPRRAKLVLAAVAVTVLLIAAAAVVGFGRSSASSAAGGPYHHPPLQSQFTP